MFENKLHELTTPLLLLQLGVLLDRRVWPFVIPVLSFVLIYSKLPHKVIYIQILSSSLDCTFI